jgi:hypothetical protein
VLRKLTVASTTFVTHVVADAVQNSVLFATTAPAAINYERDVLAANLPLVPAMPPPAPPVRASPTNSRDDDLSQPHVQAVQPTALDLCRTSNDILSMQIPVHAEELRSETTPAVPSSSRSAQSLERPGRPAMGCNNASTPELELTTQSIKDYDTAVYTHEKALLAAADFLKRIRSVLNDSLLSFPTALVHDIDTVSLTVDNNAARLSAAPVEHQILVDAPTRSDKLPEHSAAMNFMLLMSSSDSSALNGVTGNFLGDCDAALEPANTSMSLAPKADLPHTTTTAVDNVQAHKKMVAQADVVNIEDLTSDTMPAITASGDEERAAAHVCTIHDPEVDTVRETFALQAILECSSDIDDSYPIPTRASDAPALLRKISIDATGMHLQQIIAPRMWLAGLCTSTIRHFRAARRAAKMWTVGHFHGEVRVHRLGRTAAKLFIMSSVIRIMKAHRLRKAATKLGLVGTSN